MKLSSPAPLHRTGVLLLTAAFLLAQLVGFAHLAEERHEVCHEHGELFHVGASPAAEVPRESDGPAVSPTERGADHAHCGLALFHRTSPRPSLAAALDPHTAPLEVVGLVLEAGGVESSVALLLQAPKQSPPLLP